MLQDVAAHFEQGGFHAAAFRHAVERVDREDPNLLLNAANAMERDRSENGCQRNEPSACERQLPSDSHVPPVPPVISAGNDKSIRACRKNRMPPMRDRKSTRL